MSGRAGLEWGDTGQSSVTSYSKDRLCLGVVIDWNVKYLLVITWGIQTLSIITGDDLGFLIVPDMSAVIQKKLFQQCLPGAFQNHVKGTETASQK